MNQNHFPPLLCFGCELEHATYQIRLREWRKANASRGRHWTYGKPVEPRGCQGDVLSPCCHERFHCGAKHGHPTDEEEEALQSKFDDLIFGPPTDADGRGTVYRGCPQAPCVVCDEPASRWIGQNRPVCRACYGEVMESMAQRKAIS
jgi:hypothetical protein